MTQLGYAVLGLVLGAALGAVVFGTWRRSAATPSTRVEARLEVQAAELRRLADASAAREGSAEHLRSEFAGARRVLESLALREDERRVRDAESWEIVRRLSTVLVGSASKGRAGENVLREHLAQLPPGMLVTDLRVNGRVVEFGLLLPDGRRLPVDSKWSAVAELEALEAADDPIERETLAREVERQVALRAREVAQYLDPSLTAPVAVAAVPGCRVRGAATGARRRVLARGGDRAVLDGAAGAPVPVQPRASLRRRGRRAFGARGGRVGARRDAARPGEQGRARGHDGLERRRRAPLGSGQGPRLDRPWSNGGGRHGRAGPRAHRGCPEGRAVARAGTLRAMEFEETLATLGFHPASGRTPKGVQVLTAEPNAFLTYTVQKLEDGTALFSWEFAVGEYLRTKGIQFGSDETLNQFMFPREDTRGPQDGTWLVEAIERATAQLASLRFDRPA